MGKGERRYRWKGCYGNKMERKYDTYVWMYGKEAEGKGSVEGETSYTIGAEEKGYAVM